MTGAWLPVEKRVPLLENAPGALDRAFFPKPHLLEAVLWYAPYESHLDGHGTIASSESFGIEETPARALECPIQLEAKLARVNPVTADGYYHSVHERCVECTLEGIVSIEVGITRVHAHASVLTDGKPSRIDPDRWRPLIMSFHRFFGLGPELSESRFAGIPEAMYRTLDIDRASLAAS